MNCIQLDAFFDDLLITFDRVFVPRLGITDLIMSTVNEIPCCRIQGFFAESPFIKGDSPEALITLCESIDLKFKKENLNYQNRIRNERLVTFLSEKTPYKYLPLEAFRQYYDPGKRSICACSGMYRRYLVMIPAAFSWKHPEISENRDYLVKNIDEKECLNLILEEMSGLAQHTSCWSAIEIELYFSYHYLKTFKRELKYINEI